MSNPDRYFSGGRVTDTGAIGTLHQVVGADLRNGDRLITATGAELIVHRVHPSPHRPAAMSADTELGELLVPKNATVTVRRAGNGAEKRQRSGVKKILAIAGNILQG
ncbi:hypothetical protein ACFVAJ_18860 [Agromyces sp. NPDC057679]|uniref:hypothetical protein n=1 Tax=Agromyces sp. NPDC057679 TaxID=3346207 RepID=UPI003671BB65